MAEEIQDKKVEIASSDLRYKAGFAKTHSRRSVGFFLDEDEEADGRTADVREDTEGDTNPTRVTDAL